MEIQSAKTTPDTSPSTLIPPFISWTADRTEHFRLSPHLPLVERSKIYRSTPRDLDHGWRPTFGRGRPSVHAAATAKRSDHGRFYSTDLTRPPRRHTVLITNLPRQERLICRGELNGVFSRALGRFSALKIGGPKRDDVTRLIHRPKFSSCFRTG